MKTIKQISFVLVLALITTLSSCSSDGGGGSASASLGTIKAKVAGSSFTSMTAATFATKQVVGGATTIVVQGGDASGRTIQLMITGATTPTGTFEISDTASIATIASYTELNLSTMTSQIWAAPFDGSGATGSITITEVTDTNVKGTFTFTAKNQAGSDTKHVTDGAFNVNFSS